MTSKQSNTYPALCLWLLITTVLSASVYASDISGQSAQENVVEFYQPSHQLADELKSSINALYEDEVKLAVENQQLIIRGERAKVNEILEMLAKLDKAPQRFNVEISNNPGKSGAKTYSTNSRAVSQGVFTLTENIPFITVKETRAQTVNGVRPLLWSRVEEIPVQQEYLQLTVKGSQDHVYVTVKMQTLQNGRFAMINNEISGPSYQWLSIGSNGNRTTSTSTKTYGTNSRDIDALYIKVTPAN
ncbi:hypothetical protein [Oceanicoccus sagamiensis]|uniref:NolW-like domain-containing protein n=1 Tax=Oceanicoccus sagamiensis TaxID=716816 RepID=A0A1X9NE09_9GAMM|nr:hypothetical protein [Oceanicoccus sagamiensis]ARN75796.1 hypothetical protein BST96_17790 [Oceanicoccus sagamiensis]